MVLPVGTAPTSDAVGICTNLLLEFKVATPFAFPNKEVSTAPVSAAFSTISELKGLLFTVLLLGTAPTSDAVGICFSFPFSSKPAAPLETFNFATSNFVFCKL